MKGKLILPPNYLESYGKLIFLAGPIQGAYNWQLSATKIINSNSELDIANPRRNIEIEGDFSQDEYNEQVDWETFHLRKAGKNGVILFWLAKEYDHKCNRSYAQTTRFEIGEWKVRHEYYGCKLAVGIEAGFTNERYIRRRFSQDCPEIKIHSTLEETCMEAIRSA